ncbi:MAG: heavy metal translocating P-type ATPase [Pseudomonadota bacterium]
MSHARCYHCGDVIPAGADFSAEIDGKTQAMCCVGCVAAAEFIAGAGLVGFYQQREATAAATLRPDDRTWRDFDDHEVAGQFVVARGDALSEATIYIGDLYCPACIWLVTEILEVIPGVDNVAANPASRRITVSWRSDQVTLGTLLARVAAVGFKPEPVTPGQTSEGERNDYRLAIRRLVVAGIFGMQAMMFAIGLYSGEFQGMTEGMRDLLAIASLVVTLPIIAYAAIPFYRGAWLGVVQRQPGMDVPVTLAIGIAFVASVLATFRGGDVYYDSIAMFVTLLCLSRFLEMRARHRADDRAEAMANMLPAAVSRVGTDGREERVARAAIQMRDRLRFATGDVVAADGVILQGAVDVDESFMTGEADPVARTAGDTVLAGTRVLAGNAVIEVAETGASTQLAEVARLIERAQGDRGALQGTADRIASWFVMAVIAIASVTAIAWWQLAPERVLPIVLSVLIVACPCALALATPTALASAAANLSRRGILLVRARLLEAMRSGAVIVLDKTGTLTRGAPEIASETCYLDADATRCRAIAAALEADSGHVLAQAFADGANESVVLDAPPEIHVGRGVSGRIDGKTYRIGKRAFVAEAGAAISPVAPESGIYLADDEGVLARYTVRDALRDDAAETIEALVGLGFEPVIASGDHPAAVAEIAGRVGTSRHHADLSPADKLELVRRERAAGHRVIMIGDGVNDAPVLAAADASIAIGNGAALARASADAILLGHHLSPLRALADVSVRTRRVIAQSLGWAAGYNLLAVSVATLGFVAPWMAAIGMSASSLIVVANALRLNRDANVKPPADSKVADDPALEATA